MKTDALPLPANPPSFALMSSEGLDLDYIRKNCYLLAVGQLGAIGLFNQVRVKPDGIADSNGYVSCKALVGLPNIGLLCESEQFRRIVASAMAYEVLK